MQLEMVSQYAAADGGLRFGANVAGIGLFAATASTSGMFGSIIHQLGLCAAADNDIPTSLSQHGFAADVGGIGPQIAAGRQQQLATGTDRTAGIQLLATDDVVIVVEMVYLQLFGTLRTEGNVLAGTQQSTAIFGLVGQLGGIQTNITLGSRRQRTIFTGCQINAGHTVEIGNMTLTVGTASQRTAAVDVSTGLQQHSLTGIQYPADIVDVARCANL